MDSIYKTIYILVFVCLCIPFATALTFDGQTKYTNDNLAYIFSEGINIGNFELVDGGIIIDDKKFGFQLQGGMANIHFYNLNDGSEKIGIKTTAEQTIRFSALFDGKRQFFYDGDSNYLDSYEMPRNEVIFTFNEVYDEQSVDDDIDDLYDTEEPLRWSDKRLFEVELFKEKNEQGIIESRTLRVTNIGAIIFVLSFFIVYLGWWYAFR